jgi:hypothetical protein
MNEKTTSTGAFGRVLDEMVQETLGINNGITAEEPVVSQNDFWRQNMFMIVGISVVSMFVLGLVIGLDVVDRRRDKQRRERVAAVVGDDITVGGVV